MASIKNERFKSNIKRWPTEGGCRMEKIISGEECYKKKIIEWAQQQSDEKLMKLISLQDRLLSQQLSRKP